MRVLNKEYDLWGRCRAYIQGDSGIEYVTTIDIEDNEAWCSCPAFVYSKENKECKHIFHLLFNLERNKMVNKTKELPKLPTGSKIIDGLLGGGVPFKLVTAVFSPPSVGKSWMGYQIGVNNIKITGKGGFVTRLVL